MPVNPRTHSYGFSHLCVLASFFLNDFFEEFFVKFKFFCWHLIWLWYMAGEPCDFFRGILTDAIPKFAKCFRWVGSLNAQLTFFFFKRHDSRAILLIDLHFNNILALFSQNLCLNFLLFHFQILDIIFFYYHIIIILCDLLFVLESFIFFVKLFL